MSQCDLFRTGIKEQWNSLSEKSQICALKRHTLALGRAVPARRQSRSRPWATVHIQLTRLSWAHRTTRPPGPLPVWLALIQCGRHHWQLRLTNPTRSCSLSLQPARSCYYTVDAIARRLGPAHRRNRRQRRGPGRPWWTRTLDRCRAGVDGGGGLAESAPLSRAIPRTGPAAQTI